MQAIILAAGMGKRLKELTQNNTKCMVKINEKTLIERVLTILDTEHLSKIIVVIGYKAKTLKKYIETLSIKTPIIFIENPVYEKTNNIYSLALTRDYLIAEDTLLFESDLIFNRKIVDDLIADPRQTLAVVDKFASWMDGTCMKLDSEDHIIDFIPGKYLRFSEKEEYYKTVNIYKFSRHFSETTYVPFLEAYEKAMGNNEYYESVIKLIAMLDTKEIRARRLTGEYWYEIDDIQDLEIAEVLFNDDPKKKYNAVCHRFGGYWRFPKLIDFCYLVNPYFPPQKMVDEISANFDTLLREYPSGMAVNSLLAAKDFNVRKESIVVGNGAAELIQQLVEKHLSGRIGVIRPTFEEYSNRAAKQQLVVYKPSEFVYSTDDIISFFSMKENTIDNLVLINPDNPSGNMIDATGIKKIISWCRHNSIRLILDESFIDFADPSTNPLECLKDEMLSSYLGLVVIKSISKSYGIPGLRLGVLACADEMLIQTLKKDVSIWNINSFGEFYLQIFEKYRKDYEASLQKIRRSRLQLFTQLQQIDWIKPYPSQANYIMCELQKGIKSEDVCALLLKSDHILIKDLSVKIGNGREYIRIAVRSDEENMKLIEALKRYYTV
jgi:histidinol-phosphate/aromatic aminotransferase/cobyric acid decarboxylase-like protein/choline kinase